MIFDETVAFPLKFNQLKKMNEHRKQNADMQEPLLQEPMMRVSYNNSAFKEEAFLIFAANQKICGVLEKEEMTYETRESLLRCYMELNKRSDFLDLTAVVGQMLLEKKGCDIEDVDVDDMFMNTNERAKFASDHPELIDKWILFLDSVLINMPYALKGYAEQRGEEVEKHYGTIEDLTYIGLTVSNLLVSPGYLEAFLSKPAITEPKVFTEHLYEPVFSGHTLINVLASGNNSIFPFMVAMYQDWISEESNKEMASGDS